MKKVLFWTADSNIEYYVPFPEQAKKNVPKWYKKISRYNSGNKLVIHDNGSDNLGVKACVPFYDAMTAGYVIKLHCDVFVERDENNNAITKWRSDIPPLVGRAEATVRQIPQIAGYSPFSFAWEVLYSFILPKGYSALFIQPMNRFDLPFIVSSGIVDGDNGVGNGALPFAINDNFSGVIPAGTPIVQVMPFKREDWKTKLLEKQPKRAINFVPMNESAWYKKRLWVRKSYE